MKKKYQTEEDRKAANRDRQKRWYEKNAKQTKDFANWQIQDSVVAKIRVDIIKKLVELSRTHTAISKEKVDYIPFAEQVMKYIVRYY